MSQYSVVPKANDRPLNIGTMAMSSRFQGAVAKIAIYDYLLTGELGIQGEKPPVGVAQLAAAVPE